MGHLSSFPITNDKRMIAQTYGQKKTRLSPGLGNAIQPVSGRYLLAMQQALDFVFDTQLLGLEPMDDQIIRARMRFFLAQHLVDAGMFHFQRFNVINKCHRRSPLKLRLIPFVQTKTVSQISAQRRRISLTKCAIFYLSAVITSMLQ
jgi:hypothetical protein